MSDVQPLLEVRGAGHRYGCRDVDLDLWPGEVLAVVGIFHDVDVREAVADRVVDVETFASAVGAAA